MSLFNLHSQVLADYCDFVRSFLTVADARVRQFVESALVEEARLRPDFRLQVSPAYARAATMDELAAQGVLHEETARIFRTPEGNPFHRYLHQVEAREKARGGEVARTVRETRGPSYQIQPLMMMHMYEFTHSLEFLRTSTRTGSLAPLRSSPRRSTP